MPPQRACYFLTATYFIAHVGADLDFARALYHILKPGLPVWLDQEDLLPGDDWDLEIPRA